MDMAIEGLHPVRSKTEERRKAGVNTTGRRAPGACGTEMRATAAKTRRKTKTNGYRQDGHHGTKLVTGLRIIRRHHRR